MSLEHEISQMPKTLLAVLVIGGVVLLMFIFNPPHTICDTQSENVKVNMAGVLFPEKVKKDTIQPRIGQARADCRSGNSPGACYEYFSLIKRIIQQLSQSNPECRPQVIRIAEVDKALRDGVENMALLAWGYQPPESPALRAGWMQESELALFCQLKDIYIKSKGEEGWNALRMEVNRKYPGPLPAGAAYDAERPKAFEKMNETDLWNRSLFSIRCDGIY